MRDVSRARPVMTDHASKIGQARLLESLIGLTMGVARGGLGPFFYRFSGPGAFSAG